jgi:hypothetical protein
MEQADVEVKVQILFGRCSVRITAFLPVYGGGISCCLSEDPTASVVCGLWSVVWLQIQRSGFDSRPYPLFWEVVALERNPLSLVSTNEELLGRKSSGSGLKSREYGGRDLSRWPRGTLYQQKLVLTSPTSGGRYVGIVRSRTQATEFSLVYQNIQENFRKVPELDHDNFLPHSLQFIICEMYYPTTPCSPAA